MVIEYAVVDSPTGRSITQGSDSVGRSAEDVWRGKLLDQQSNTRNGSGNGDRREDTYKRKMPAYEFGYEKRACDAAKAAHAEHPRDTGATPFSRIKGGRKSIH